MRKNRSLQFSLLIASTVLSLAGIDLILPAIPQLSQSLSGTVNSAQYVLAAFAAGTACGLLLYGELGARFNQHRLLILSLLLYCGLSYLATLVDSISDLIGIRFIQGMACSAPAVFAPGMIRSLFSERGALRAVGLMGSIESLTPAFAPVIGAWLLNNYDWRASFLLTSGIALALAIAWLFLSDRKALNSKPKQQKYNPKGNYKDLFSNTEFLRQATSHAGTLGGLLVFVFGAPTVIIHSMGGQLSDFVIMQIIGISLFIISANFTHRLVDHFGSAQIILFGSTLSAFGSLLIFFFSLTGYHNPQVLWLLFIPVNLGLGLRGPPGFYQAVIASGDNDARGAALLVLFILGTAAGGTAIVAPFIHLGLLPLSGVACLISCTSVLILLSSRNNQLKTLD